MLQRLRRRLRREEGFTLIELLVVILIIGILAAIAIPSFLNQKGKGEDTQAKTAARTAQTAFETFYTDNNTYACGSDSATCVTALKAIEAELPDAGAGNGEMTVAGPDGTGVPTQVGYQVNVKSDSSGRVFSIRKNGSTVTHPCSKPDAADNNGGCKITSGTTGTW